MHFSLVDKLPWAVALLVDLALLFVLVSRNRWRQFPIFTTWFAFMVVRSLLLFVSYVDGSRYWYTRIYQIGFWIDFALQLGIAVEIARILLRPTGTWVQDARFRFAAGGFAGAATAAVLSWWVTPPTSTVRLLWQIRGNLFTSLVICELFVVMSLTANRLGLGWRSHVMAVGQGLTAWSTLMVIKTAIESFVGTGYLYTQLERARGVTYIAAVCWMTVQLWRQEPERQPISADLQEYILALHRRVEYDLRRLDARH
jgi:hypothetical protein